jgi:hypothetical protein
MKNISFTKLIAAQVVRKLPSLYGTVMFITVLKISRDWILSEPAESGLCLYTLVKMQFNVVFPPSLGFSKCSPLFQFSTFTFCMHCPSVPSCYLFRPSRSSRSTCDRTNNVNKQHKVLNAHYAVFFSIFRLS